MNDPYLILGLLEQKIDGSLDDKTVKAAYMKLLQQYPPEREPEQFKTIRKAFEQLETHKKRLKYDVLDITAPNPQDLSVLLPEASLRRPSLKLVQQLLG
jgi:DnaJ-class molecular chaperone